MKRTVTFLIAFLVFSITFSQTINHEVTEKNGKKMLLGTINKDGLTKAPYSQWFNKQHNDYDVNTKVVNKLKDSLKDYTVKVFLGTWCGDSKRQVPRLYHVLETANFPENQLEVYALDHSSENYKQGPNGEEKGMNIHRVPTIIFYKDGKEVNRIVEKPQETLERDIDKIVNNKRYNSKYTVANMLFASIEKSSLEQLKKNEASFLSSFAEYSEGSKELNSLGYVYKHDKQIEKAIYVFDLNTKMFPKNANTYDSLGEAYFDNKNYTEALKNYNKVLELKPKNKNALKMIKEIKKAEDRS